MKQDYYADEDLYYALYEDLNRIFGGISIDEFARFFKQRLQASPLNEELFAEQEIKEFEGVIKEIDKLNCIPDYVPQDPNYYKAKGYITYLNSITVPNDTAGEYDKDIPGKLQSELVNYITISVENLHRLMTGDNIKPGTSAKWIGKNRADAFRFAYWLTNGEGRYKQRFNQNIQIEGRPLHANDGYKKEKSDKEDHTKSFMEQQGTIWDILRNYPK